MTRNSLSLHLLIPSGSVQTRAITPEIVGPLRLVLMRAQLHDVFGMRPSTAEASISVVDLLQLQRFSSDFGSSGCVSVVGSCRLV
eukprot:3463797-Rhodomonas_salina.1